MDIPVAFPTVSTPTAATLPAARLAGQGAQGAAVPQAPERKLHDASGGSAKGVNSPQIVHTHTELEFDETLNRVVGRIVNEQTGETIQEIPPEQLKALYRKMREQLGSLVDGTA